MHIFIIIIVIVIVVFLLIRFSDARDAERKKEELKEKIKIIEPLIKKAESDKRDVVHKILDSSSPPNFYRYFIEDAQNQFVKKTGNDAKSLEVDSCFIFLETIMQLCKRGYMVDDVSFINHDVDQFHKSDEFYASVYDQSYSRITTFRLVYSATKAQKNYYAEKVQKGLCLNISGYPNVIFGNGIDKLDASHVSNFNECLMQALINLKIIA